MVIQSKNEPFALTTISSRSNTTRSRRLKRHDGLSPIVEKVPRGRSSGCKAEKLHRGHQSTRWHQGCTRHATAAVGRSYSREAFCDAAARLTRTTTSIVHHITPTTPFRQQPKPADAVQTLKNVTAYSSLLYQQKHQQPVRRHNTRHQTGGLVERKDTRRKRDLSCRKGIDTRDRYRRRTLLVAMKTNQMERNPIYIYISETSTFTLDRKHSVKNTARAAAPPRIEKILASYSRGFYSR